MYTQCKYFVHYRCVNLNCPNALANEYPWLEHVDCDVCDDLNRMEGCPSCVFQGDLQICPLLNKEE